MGTAVMPAAASPVVVKYSTSSGYVYRVSHYIARTVRVPVRITIGGKTGTMPKPSPTPSPSPSPSPAPVPVPSGLTAMEQQMVSLVNQERTNQGLKPLLVDMKLVKVARMKSQDMIDNNYFAHQSPRYGSPFDLMRAQGITYHYAGENLAGAASVPQAHNNLMNSSGHRANILNANYTSIGIGIIQGGPYGLMISQEFTG